MFDFNLLNVTKYGLTTDLSRLETSLIVFIVLYSVKCFPLDVQELYKVIS